MASVLNRTTMVYLISVNTPDYDPADWLVNPDTTPVVGVPVYYWKLTGDVLSEMTVEEKEVVDTSREGEKNFLVATYTANKSLDKETWYQNDDGGGTYSGVVEETTYSYSGKKLTSKSIQAYLLNGTAIGVPEVWNYYTDANNRKIQKRQS